MKAKILLVLTGILLSSCAIADKSSNLETNKQLVADFYQEVLFEGKHQNIDQYIGDTYIQHNPGVADGKEALVKLIKQIHPDSDNLQSSGEIVRIIAEGDLVVLHVKNAWGPQQVAIVDIFRVENGKIVEHWDVIQKVPAKSANENTMF